jgi:hypothetical protein
MLRVPPVCHFKTRSATSGTFPPQIAGQKAGGEPMEGDEPGTVKESQPPRKRARGMNKDRCVCVFV